MKKSIIVRNAIMKHKENGLILANELYFKRLQTSIDKQTFNQTLSRMCKSGELMRIARGIYHLPKIGKSGLVPPSEHEIVSAFTSNGTGTVVGYSLYNQLNLTTQISKHIDVLSSKIETSIKTIGNVIVHRVPIHYSESSVKMIQILEVLENYHTIEDLNQEAFVEFTKEIVDWYNEDAFQQVIAKLKYKDSTIAFLRGILNSYNRENNLN